MKLKPKSIASLLPAALAAMLACSCASAPKTEPRETDFQKMVKDAKKDIYPAVVFIKAVRDAYSEGERKSQEVAGSGVIISPDGKVLTNWHVIEKAKKIRCLLYSGEACDAELLGSDKEVDMALLKLKPSKPDQSFPFAELGDSSKLKEGDFVMAVGAPWGLTRSISVGIVSCARRYIPNSGECTLMIQTDASISPGNSGGPLVSMDGKVIGINSLGILSGGSMGMAIPSNTISDLVGQLERNGKIQWSWTGLSLQPLRDFKRDDYSDANEGVIVQGVESDSPAAKAGLLPKDRIISVNGKPVTALSEEDLPDIKRMLGLLPKEAPAKLLVARGKETLQLTLVPREKGKVDGQELDCPRWDFSAKAINQFSSPSLYFQRKAGAYVFGVKYPGNAASSGLQRNDIITKANGKEISSLDDLNEASKASLNALKDKKPGANKLLLDLLRNGSPVKIVIDLSQDFDN